MEVLGHPAAAGRQAREHRCAARDLGEVRERERRARLPCDREQVQDPVRRAAAAGDTGHRVQQRAPVEEASCGHALLDEPDCERPRLRRRVVLDLSLVCGNEAVADPCETEAVESHRHRVSGEVAGARAGARACVLLELVEVGARHQPALFRADGLPDVLDRDLAAAPAAGAHRPAVDDDGGLVDARQRHQRRRHRLVAADQADEAVEVVGVHHQLDRVGDHLARDQRGAHPRRRLRLVVRDGNRVEAERDAAGRGHAVADAVGEPAQAEVARHRPRPGRGDADDRAVEARRVDSHGTEVRPRRRALGGGGEPCSRATAKRLLFPSHDATVRWSDAARDDTRRRRRAPRGCRRRRLSPARR